MLRYKFLLILMGIKQNNKEMKQKLRIIGLKKTEFFQSTDFEFWNNF